MAWKLDHFFHRRSSYRLAADIGTCITRTSSIMKLAVVLLVVFGTATCSLEPVDYRPPSSRYLPPTHPRPTSSYLAPGDSRGAPPSTSYGLPDHRASQRVRSRQEYSRQDEQHEPARYDFGYQVRDNRGNDYGHQESREGSRTRGSYRVLLPDGRRQLVEYVADEEGFKPRVSYEASGGRSAYPGAPY